MIEFVIELVITLSDSNFASDPLSYEVQLTIKSTSRSDPLHSVHVYAQEHTSLHMCGYRGSECLRGFWIPFPSVSRFLEFSRFWGSR